MDGHITNRPAAKIPPTAPFERHIGAVVVALGGRPQPQVPIEVRGHLLRHRRPGHALGPPAPGAVSDHMHLPHRPDRARLDQLHQPDVTRVLMVLGAHLGGQLLPCRQPGDQPGLLHSVGERLLAIDMQAPAQGPRGRRGMVMVGGADHHGFQIFLLEQLAVIGILAGPGMPGPGGTESAAVHITEGDDILARHPFQVAGTPAAHANGADVQFATRARHPPVAAGWQGTRQHASGKRCHHKAAPSHLSGHESPSFYLITDSISTN